MRRLLRWVLLVGPCRIYLRGDANGGSVPVVFILGLFATAAGTGGVGVLIAIITGASAVDYFWNGAIAGVGVVTAWAVYAGLLLVVLSIVDRPPRTIPGAALPHDGRLIGSVCAGLAVLVTRWRTPPGLRGDGAPDRPASSRGKVTVDRPVSGAGDGQMSRLGPGSGTIRS